MNQRDRYVARFGPEAGPKLYHALRSRAGYIGISRRRGRAIEELTGRPLRAYRPAVLVEPAAPEAGDGPDRGQALAFPPA